MKPDPNSQPPVRAYRRWLRFAVVLAGMIWAITLADLGAKNAIFLWVEQHPGSDKVCHFLLLFALAFTLDLAMNGRVVRFGTRRCQASSLIVAILITVEEVSQRWIPSRQFDWADLAANYAGILCADWLARWRLR